MIRRRLLIPAIALLALAPNAVSAKYACIYNVTCKHDELSGIHSHPGPEGRDPVQETATSIALTNATNFAQMHCTGSVSYVFGGCFEDGRDKDKDDKESKKMGSRAKRKGDTLRYVQIMAQLGDGEKVDVIRIGKDHSEALQFAKDTLAGIAKSHGGVVPGSERVASGTAFRYVATIRVSCVCKKLHRIIDFEIQGEGDSRDAAEKALEAGYARLESKCKCTGGCFSKGSLRIKRVYNFGRYGRDTELCVVRCVTYGGYELIVGRRGHSRHHACVAAESAAAVLVELYTKLLAIELGGLKHCYQVPPNQVIQLITCCPAHETKKVQKKGGKGSSSASKKATSNNTQAQKATNSKKQLTKGKTKKKT